MLVPKIFVQGLFLSTLQSYVIGSALPVADGELVTVNADIVILTGKPELLSRDKLTPRIPEAELEQDAHLFTRALNKDETEALRLHNAARSKKKLKALAWDSKLQADALKWAKELVKKKKLEHSSGNQRTGQGENLAYAKSSGTISNPMTMASNMWIAEAPSYKGEVIPKGDFGKYGHYTQIMWKSTTKVGIATASDGKGAYYTVARYSPPGNYVGQKPY